MTTWNDIRLPAHEERLWELYHENSKASQNVRPGVWQDAELEKTLDSMHLSLPVQSKWSTELDLDKNAFEKSLSDILKLTSENPGNERLTFKQLSTILGVSIRLNTSVAQGMVNFFPLEIFGVSSNMDTMPSGVFHVDKEHGQIQLIQEGIEEERLSQCFPDQKNATTYLFITAIFQRSALLFGEKGYRVAITESGRLCQNILIAAAAIGVHAKTESQYYEREIERLIGIDGVEHALLQVIAL
jgi:SagB-type dehydrogenase family enzyme